MEKNGQSPIIEHPDAVLLNLYVQPSASRTEFAGIHNGALRLRVAAPPVAGAANTAIIDFLAKQLKVRKSDIELVAGQTGRRKRVVIRGLMLTDLQFRLEIP